MPRGGSRPSTPGAIILQPLADTVIRDLFDQACIGNHPAEPWLDCMRRMVELVREEFQGQVYEVAHRREQQADYRRSRSAAPETEM